ncbi:MAG: hypothetical protein ACE5PO_02070 [Candidatus Bathyarchaeia archaeon]
MSASSENAKKPSATAKPRSPFGMMLLIVIGLLAAFFLVNGFDLYSQGNLTAGIPYLILGILGLLFSALMLNRLSGRMAPPAPKVTVTLIECLQCAVKNLRNFQVGDHIPKPVGVCSSCGGQQIIQAIYVEDQTPRKSREESY